MPEIRRHVAIYWTGRMVARLVSFLLIPVYTAYIIPADWGILNLFIVSGDLALLMISCQLPSALYRFWALSKSEAEKRELSGLVMLTPAIISIPLFLPIYIWAESFSNFAGISGYGNYIRVLLVTMQLNLIFNVIQTEMRLRNESGLYALLEIGLNFALAGINIFFVVVMTLGIKGILIGNLVIYIFFVSMMLPRFLHRSSLNINRRALKKMLAFSLPLIPSALAMASVHNIDRYIIQWLQGPVDVGLYSMGYKFGMLVNIIVFGPFLLVWEPKSYEFAGERNASDKYGEVFSYLLALTVFVAIGLTGASNEIVQVMTHQRYWGACQVIPLIGWSYVLFAMDGVARMGLLVNHKTKTLAMVVLLTCVINIIGNLILVVKMGIVGAAWSTLISFATLFLLDCILARKHLPINWQWRRLGIIAIAAVIIIYGMLSLKGMLLWQMVVAKGAALLFFPLLLLLFGFFNKKELAFIFRRNK